MFIYVFGIFIKGLFMSLAEKLIKEFEENVVLRKRLAELLVSEPDVRLALINAVIADVATKKDLNELRNELRGEISRVREELRGEISRVREELRGEIGGLRGEISKVREELRGEIGELRGEMNGLRGEIGGLRGEISKVREELRGEMNGLRGEIGELRGEINGLRREIHSNFRWTVGLIVTVWGATVIPILLKLIGTI